MTPDEISKALGPSDEDQFSTIFRRLVKSSDDLVGLIAYGIYKQSKRDWIIQYKEKHKRRPNSDAMNDYHDHFTDTDLDRFRNEAEGMMVAFSDVIVADKRPYIEKEIRELEFSALKRDIQVEIKNSTKLSTAILASVIAWFISLAIIALVVVVMNRDVLISAFRTALGID